MPTPLKACSFTRLNEANLDYYEYINECYELEEQ